LVLGARAALKSASVWASVGALKSAYFGIAVLKYRLLESSREVAAGMTNPIRPPDPFTMTSSHAWRPV
jgi:hypothetical protein